MFPSSQNAITLQIDATFDRSRPAWIFYITFAVTVLLWLTEPLHHIESTVVGFVPVTVLLCTGVFSARDLQGVQWDVLWLVGGGIALGTGVAVSGLDSWLIGLVRWDAISPALLGIALCTAALLMSTVISNSATANLLVPIGMSLAVSGVVDISPTLAAVFIAVGASLAMALPISTPPNAIAYSSGTVTTRQMATVGAIVGVIGLVLFTLFAPWTWQLLGANTP
jgi:sodium-dependent dicarboxylate transporter 2/3/5